MKKKTNQRPSKKPGAKRAARSVAAEPAISKKLALRLYEGMLRTYLFEERLSLLYRQGELFGGLYTGRGNEAVSVGGAAALEPGEVMAQSHRGIGAHFMRGETPLGMMLQLMARAEGGTKGRDNAAHQGSMERGILAMISHLATMPALGAGCALASNIVAARGGKTRRGARRRRAVLAFIGEGSTSLGDFHETMNLAAVLQLPFVMVIENNQWAYSTPTSAQYRCAKLSDRAAGYGIPGTTIDGTDVELVYTTVSSALERARAGGGPTLIEAVTMRLSGHSAADMAEYVPPEMKEQWERKHPEKRYRKTLLKRGLLTARDQKEMESRLLDEIERALVEAKAAALPEPQTALDDVYAPASPPAPRPKPKRAAEAITYLESIRQTLFEEMRADERVFCLGEDIAAFGGAFKVTKGLLEEFGEARVIDTPIAESGITGLAIGAALSGLRPVLEMQFADFVTNAFTQIVYNAAKSFYRWGQPVPLVIRLPVGGALSAGPFHSANPEAWFLHVPGLKIVAPATVDDARELLRAAIADPNPVLYLEHKYLYRRIKAIPDPEHVTEIGRARIARRGTDASIITFGMMVHRALEAAERLAAEGADVEVVDLRSLLPWDRQTVLESAKRTSRVMVLHEAPKTGGVGAEIASTIGELAFEHLDAPLVRLAAHDTPIAFAPQLEEMILPGVEDIVLKLRSLLDY